MTSTSLGRAGLSSLYDQPKAKTRGARIQEMGKKNYLRNDSDDEDEDQNDEEGYQIDPSVQLFKSIDFGRNKGRPEPSPSSSSSKMVSKRVSASRSLDSEPVQHTEFNPALAEVATPTLLGHAKHAPVDTDLSSVERDTLLDALAKMRRENEILVRQMEDTQRESRLLLEKERAERVSVVNRMQEENARLTRSLLKAQSDAEEALAAEKEKLRQALKLMESEKASLMQRINATEENAKEEIFRMQYQKAEFERNVQRLEDEKTALQNRVADNEQQAARANAAVGQELANERAALNKRIQRMEDERNAMLSQLKESERVAKEHAAQLATQLAQERDELRINLERMELEKVALSASLNAKEKDAEHQAEALREQLSKDRADLLEALSRIEAEKDALAHKVKDAELQGRETEELRAQRLEMEARMKDILAEKEDLAEKLRTTEAAAKERDDLEARRHANERQELLQAVQKMKEELITDRANDSSSSGSPGHGGSGGSPHSGGGGGGGGAVVVGPNQSLFDLMENSTVGNTSPISRFIGAIPEGDETGENFMSLDDDEDGEGGGEDEGDAADKIFSDLPAPHEAAARGDMDRLMILGGLEPSLLTSMDASSRSPLFYAAAYGHNEAAKFLAEKQPLLVTAPDSHGDTPLHAAASAGRSECLQLLLTAISNHGDASSVIDPRNHMGMSPIHMATTAECMEILYTYGADIAATDDQGRSPLFVACAMNRSECAEFLITSLDQIESSLLLKDNRGDTPLHAAACNGSEDCLLLLLQFAIDPRVTNDKGLKAIDLAIKNKQKKCRQLLAEYHLHYGTSSDFDSVLFLATLEGHKQAKGSRSGGEGAGFPGAVAPVSSPGGGQYQIIKKPSFSDSYSASNQSSGSFSGGGLGAGGLPRGKSLFSLTSDKSLRLQRWGSWIAYEDQSAHTIYWYNPNTCTGQWEMPEEVVKLQRLGNSHSASSRLLTGKMSMRLRKVGDWIQYVTEAGPTFYYNDKNGEFQWVNPETKDEPQTESGDWKPYKDPQSGNVFWYNRVTLISQWECPLESIPPELLLDGQSATSSPEKERYDEDVVNVGDNDELGI